MKIAIFHNFMDNIGGAEIVALSLARGLQADLYTTNIDASNIDKMGYSDVLDRIHSIGRLPKGAPFRQQLALWKFRRLDLQGRYDFFIIAGDWAMSAAVNHHPNIWYAHSPLNELWEFSSFIRKEVLNFWKRPIYDIWVWLNRTLTRRYARSVDKWVCNSKNTQNRIAKFYGREAEVIYPPVDMQNCQAGDMGDYWLSVNRLITHKRIELQMQAFQDLPSEKLIVVGSYERGAAQFEKYKEFIQSIKPENVQIKHWVSAGELGALYANCKGFITTASNEDFGMTAVEAMAHGKPVIAAAEGGYLESVIDGKTGLLIKDISAHKLKEAILEISKNLQDNGGFYQQSCLEQAAGFDISIFISKIRKIIA